MFLVIFCIYYWPDDGAYCSFEGVHVEYDEYPNWERKKLGLYERFRFRYTGTSISVDRLYEPMNLSNQIQMYNPCAASSPPLSSCSTLIIGLPLAPLVLSGHPKVLSHQRLAPLPK